MVKWLELVRNDLKWLELSLRHYHW